MSVAYETRLKQVHHPLAKKLLTLMLQKQSNVVLSADVCDPDACLALIDAVGTSVCMVKTHVDTLDDFAPSWVKALQALQSKHDFMIFEDRKFADIGHTVKQQYGGGPFHIADWADVTDAHALPGPGMVQALREVGLPKGRGLLLLAQMSSEGHLLDEAYTRSVLKMAQAAPDFVMGFIAQEALGEAAWLTLTPGIQLESKGDGLGQCYRTPLQALQSGSDALIVGRGITQADDPAEAAARYQMACWAAYRQCAVL